MPPQFQSPQAGQTPQPGQSPQAGQPQVPPQPQFIQPNQLNQPDQAQSGQYGQAGPTYGQAYNQLAASAIPQPSYPGQYPGRTPAPQQPYGQPAQSGAVGNPYAYNQQTRPPYPQTAHNQAGPSVVPPPPPRPETPYDFFMANQPAQKKKSPFGNSKPNKVVMIAVGGIGLVMLLGVVALFLPQSEPKTELVAVAQSQNEALRICNEGDENAKLQVVRSFVTNCSLSLASEQKTLLAVLSRSGAPTDGDTLAGRRNAKTDSQLAAAKSASNYDEAFIMIAEVQLTAYSRAIQLAASSSTTTVTEKKVLADQYKSSQLLLQQLKAQST